MYKYLLNTLLCSCLLFNITAMDNQEISDEAIMHMLLEQYKMDRATNKNLSDYPDIAAEKIRISRAGNYIHAHGSFKESNCCVRAKVYIELNAIIKNQKLQQTEPLQYVSSAVIQPWIYVPIIGVAYLTAPIVCLCEMITGKKNR